MVTLRDVAVGNGVRLAGDELIYVGHWITPEPEPRRYDTRFFAARAPAGAVCDAHDAEMTDSVWLRPAEAVERFRDGHSSCVRPPCTPCSGCRLRSWELCAPRSGLRRSPHHPRMEAAPTGLPSWAPNESREPEGL